VELVCDRLWIVADNACHAFEGDLSDYRNQLAESRRAQRRATRDAGDELPENSASNRKDARRERAQQRAATADLRKAVRDHEQLIEKLTAKKEALETKLADPDVYEGSTAKLMELQVRHADIKAQLTKTEETWFELSERLEVTE
jgi:ATP-binding cassette, subfamily F, member 3